MVSITIDCEEWNSPYLRGKKDPDNFNTAFSRMGNQNLLKLFKKHNIKATFFITGFYAEREKESLKQITEEGHEIASHGYEHHYRKNPKLNLESDIQKSKRILEKISQQKIIGFRTPQMQYSQKLLYILEKLGFKYDSSLHPAFLPGYYCNQSSPLKIHQPISHLKIKEIPTAVMPLTRLPIAWMFMRNLGLSYTQLAIDGLIKRNINPNLYVHSWEFTKVKSKHVPFYFTRNTGKKFLRLMDKFITANLKKNRTFLRLKDII